MTSRDPDLPIIDVAPLVARAEGRWEVAARIGEACRSHGFFYAVGHGIDPGLCERLERESRAFFEHDLETKLSIRMAHGGRAWRGYFPVGDELTLGLPDQKEGLYFGEELEANHPKVLAGTPLHGANLFPPCVPGLRECVGSYMRAMTSLGHLLMEGIALSLALPADSFAAHFTGDPFVLFRIFHYPPLARKDEQTLWSVGEHTDYGLLTMLQQTDEGGLEVKTGDGWIQAPPVPDAFVCNIGDMLERMTGGQYRSTPHRVRNTSGRSRLSFPFFFDPGFDVRMRPLDSLSAPENDDTDRWDGTSVHGFEGTYGEYLLGKVAKVFPGLGRDVLDESMPGP